MRIRFVLILAAAALTLQVDPGHGQAPYADGNGPFFTLSPIEERSLRSDQTLLLVGAGLRLGSHHIQFRAGRFEDVPHGNPLPITYIGYTYAEGTVRRVFRRQGAASGTVASITPNLVVVDRSFPVSNLPDTVTFREGARVAEIGVGGDVHRFWTREMGPGVDLHLLVGGRLDIHRTRDSQLQHSDGEVGTMYGGRRILPSISTAAPLSLHLGDRRRLVVEPTVRLQPGYYFLPAPKVGLSLHLNL